MLSSSFSYADEVYEDTREHTNEFINDEKKKCFKCMKKCGKDAIAIHYIVVVVLWRT